MHRTSLVATWLPSHRRLCGVTLLAFFGMGRIGEVLACRRRNLVLQADLAVSSKAVFLNLDSSKTVLRGRPRIQHLRIDNALAVDLISLAFSGLPLDRG